MKATIITIAVATMLLIGCSDDDGTSQSFEPWMVVATSHAAISSDALGVRIDYFAPDGTIVRWERVAILEDYWDCWREAMIGQPLPECARSEPVPTPEAPSDD